VWVSQACLDFTTRAVTASKMRQRNQHDSGGTEVDLEEAWPLMAWLEPAIRDKKLLKARRKD